jgi:type II secretory pathway pseudopilin PulG
MSNQQGYLLLELIYSLALLSLLIHLITQEWSWGQQVLSLIQALMVEGLG